MHRAQMAVRRRHEKRNHQEYGKGLKPVRRLAGVCRARAMRDVPGDLEREVGVVRNREAVGVFQRPEHDPEPEDRIESQENKKRRPQGEARVVGSVHTAMYAGAPERATGRIEFPFRKWYISFCSL